MPSGTLLAYVAAAAGLPLAIGILVYVAGSFAMMRAHVDRRSVARDLLEALREVAWAAFTQPLLPLFYVVGRRLTRGRGTPIVVIHGYTQNRVDFLRIARGCARAGLGPVYGYNYPWFSSVHTNAVRLARFCDGVRRETGEARVDLVAHSLGGLVAMEYLEDAGPAHVRRLVTIASPHAGIAWRGPMLGAAGSQMRLGSAFLLERASRVVSVPCLSIYSSHDNVVHPPTTSMLATRGARDHAVANVGHLSILFDPEVVRAVVDFLGAPETAVERVAGPSAAALEPPRELVGA
jgi:pimeloyl-ACP methyl ester carboxylesterase